MSRSPIFRLLIASLGGVIATALFFSLVAYLNGVFFEDKDMITVTPCYFAPDTAAGIARMFKSFLPQGSLSPAEQAVRDFKAQRGAENP
jgi:hypothetical protein